MGCGGSKATANHRKEADEYAKRKKMGFKDPGLEQVRKEAIQQKKKLKHVEDPYKHRKEKVEGIKAQQKKEANNPPAAATAATAGKGKNKKGGTPAADVGGISEDAILAQRKKLKAVKK